MIVLLVEDMARSVAFYHRLGVTFPDDAARRRDVIVDLGGGHQLVLSTTFGRNVTDGDAAVDEKHAELVSMGYRSRREPFRTDFGAYLALVDDPDRNTVLITAG